MKLFEELIQISLGTRETFSTEPTADDWIAMYEESDRHCIVGVTFEGVEKYVKAHGGLSNTTLDPDLLASWYSFVQKIEERNTELNKKSSWLQSWLSKQGMTSCILKGQGNALLYPNPLHRTSGDIDVWVWMKDLDADGNPHKGKENCTRVIDWVKGKQTDKPLDAVIHHVELPSLDGVDVEAHYWPSFFFCFSTFAKFKYWCETEHLRQMDNWKSLPHLEKQISAPTTEFNLVFQLIHILRHIYAEGIGHRHLIDYFYTLSSDGYDREEVLRNIELFGITRIASGVMWIMKEVYNMPDSRLLLATDEKIGRLLLDDVERGGNFGHSDKDMMRKMKLSKPKLFLWRTYRSVQVFRICPAETLFSPLFRVFQWIWIKRISKKAQK